MYLFYYEILVTFLEDNSQYQNSVVESRRLFCGRPSRFVHQCS